MKMRQLLCGLLVILTSLSCPLELCAWGKGHRLIRLWAVSRLPQWQRQLVGQQSLDRLCQEYTSLQDKHAGGNAPQLDPYCIVPERQSASLVPRSERGNAKCGRHGRSDEIPGCALPLERRSRLSRRAQQSRQRNATQDTAPAAARQGRLQLPVWRGRHHGHGRLPDRRCRLPATSPR